MRPVAGRDNWRSAAPISGVVHVPRSWWSAVAAWLVGLMAVVFVCAPAHGEGKAVGGVINLNTAPAELLSLLPGIGPSKARAIVAYRSRRPFRTVDELVRIKGIGRRMVRGMRAHLAVAGPSTVRAALNRSNGSGAGVVSGAAALSIPPIPPAPPVPMCRPTIVAPVKTQLARLVRGPVVKPARSPANHCMPPP